MRLVIQHADRGGGLVTGGFCLCFRETGASAVQGRKQTDDAGSQTSAVTVAGFV